MIDETEKIIREKLYQLKPETEFKSFKSLCDYLGINASGGNKRIAQKKLIEKYCKLSHVNGTNKYIVEKIYEVPLKPTNTKKDFSTLSPSELLLLNTLAVNKNHTLNIPTHKLWFIFAFINGKYFKPSCIYSIMNKYEMLGNQIDNFRQRSYKRFHQLTFSYLKHLTKLGIIEYEFITKEIDNTYDSNQIMNIDILSLPVKTKGGHIYKGFIIKGKTELDKYILSEGKKKKMIKKANNYIMDYLSKNAKNKYDNYKKMSAEIQTMPLTKFPDNLSWTYLSGYHVYTDNYLEHQKNIMKELIKINY